MTATTTAQVANLAGEYAPAVLDAGETARCVVCRQPTVIRAYWWLQEGNRPTGPLVPVCAAEMRMDGLA